MSRAPLRYADRAPVVRTFEGHDPDTPTAGYYRMRMRSGGAFVGVRIWHGLPLDPETGETMDRAHCWNAQVNGTWTSIDRVWPSCAGGATTEAEYHHLRRTQEWAKQNAPASALADPRRKIDPLTSPLPF